MQDDSQSIKDKALVKKPKYMITYWCPHCEIDVGRTELDGPFCYVCERSDNLTEIKREPLSKEVMHERMKAVADRMMNNLIKAYESREGNDDTDIEEEMMLLQALANGQDIQKTIAKL